mmetsp:Transcript_12793/g.14593  ORF Transcript_12793/g.14593 Transcript_12793/m.14593 type:complete len:139 (-) Transcript_12793:168-584(-)
MNRKSNTPKKSPTVNQPANQKCSLKPQSKLCLRLNILNQIGADSEILGIMKNGYTQRSIDKKFHSLMNPDSAQIKEKETLGLSRKSSQHSKSDLKAKNCSAVIVENLVFKAHLKQKEGKQGALSTKSSINEKKKLDIK